MIELANKQYATVIDCVAGENLQVGMAVKLVPADDGETLKAMKLTEADDAAVWGVLLAHWINPRSLTVTYSGGENGLDFPLAAASDPDAQIHIPMGQRMVAVGGMGVTQIRLFKSALDSEFATTLPVPGDILGVHGTSKFLCDTANVAAVAGLEQVARVVEADSLSVRVILGVTPGSGS